MNKARNFFYPKLRQNSSSFGNQAKRLAPAPQEELCKNLEQEQSKLNDHSRLVSFEGAGNVETS